MSVSLKRKIKKLMEDALGNLSLNNYNAGKLITITDNDLFTKYAKDVWDILYMSYEDIGGLKTYRNYRDFCKKKPIIDIVINNGNIIACATYRRIEDSLKMIAIGCDQSPLGKIGIQQIIKNNIEKLDFHYWAEVSGAIEHYFKKHNGFPMPNTLASEILKIDESDIELSKNDKVHYNREIGENSEIFTKMIFGIKNDEIYKKAIQEVENYSKFMKEVNNINESQIYTVKQAIYIIENIYRAHEEDGFNELIPSWNIALRTSLKTLESQEIKNQTIIDYIEYGKYLLSDMQLLILHELHL